MADYVKRDRLAQVPRPLVGADDDGGRERSIAMIAVGRMNRVHAKLAPPGVLP
jgi:hypothetical protein